MYSKAELTLTSSTYRDYEKESRNEIERVKSNGEVSDRKRQTENYAFTRSFIFNKFNKTHLFLCKSVVPISCMK